MMPRSDNLTMSRLMLLAWYSVQYSGDSISDAADFRIQHLTIPHHIRGLL